VHSPDYRCRNEKSERNQQREPVENGRQLPPSRGPSLAHICTIPDLVFTLWTHTWFIDTIWCEYSCIIRRNECTAVLTFRHTSYLYGPVVIMVGGQKNSTLQRGRNTTGFVEFDHTVEQVAEGVVHLLVVDTAGQMKQANGVVFLE